MTKWNIILIVWFKYFIGILNYLEPPFVAESSCLLVLLNLVFDLFARIEVSFRLLSPPLLGV